MLATATDTGPASVDRDVLDHRIVFAPWTIPKAPGCSIRGPRRGLRPLRSARREQPDDGASAPEQRRACRGPATRPAAPAASPPACRRPPREGAWPRRCLRSERPPAGRSAPRAGRPWPPPGRPPRRPVARHGRPTARSDVGRPVPRERPAAAPEQACRHGADPFSVPAVRCAVAATVPGARPPCAQHVPSDACAPRSRGAEVLLYLGLVGIGRRGHDGCRGPLQHRVGRIRRRGRRRPVGPPVETERAEERGTTCVFDESSLS